MDIWDDATGLTAAIHAKEIGSVELLDALLARVDRLNPAINAVVARDVDRARQRAVAADAATAKSESWGPLHGLPMTIKDSIETEGLVTCCGAPELRAHVPDRDATAVARLKGAGAIVFGKTNAPLMAGDVQAFNEVYGTTNNPWDLTRTPGGSSGGAAAALASAMTPLELGSDIGGSIRIPASFTGVAGMKPSYRLVPTRGHIPGPPGSLGAADIGVLGPLARSVRDLELALDVIAGPEEIDAPAWRIELPPARSTGGDLRVRVMIEHDALVTSSEVRAALRRAVDRLVDGGVKVEEADARAQLLVREGRELAGLVTSAVAPGMPEQVFAMACQAEASPPNPDESDLATAGRFLAIRHRDWLIRDEQRQQLRAGWAEWFRDVDVLLAPSFATAAFEHQQEGGILRRLVIDGVDQPYFQNQWSTVFGVAYLPAASVPGGVTDGGLPVGLQVVGPYLEDRTVLAAARTIEEQLGGFVRPPAVAD